MKLAVTISDKLFQEAEKAASQLGLNHNQLVSQALTVFLAQLYETGELGGPGYGLSDDDTVSLDEIDDVDAGDDDAPY
ncbi:MAG: hypothetical protein H6745_04470 [Deltaproteobacteria bacterium]|nr:hypothetical protein [Deltaproteobacteria bacterium]